MVTIVGMEHGTFGLQAAGIVRHMLMPAGCRIAGSIAGVGMYLWKGTGDKFARRPFYGLDSGMLPVAGIPEYLGIWNEVLALLPNTDIFDTSFYGFSKVT